jgi:predicted RNase H-related nuclease YkuK (DUF458 family)
MKYKGSGSMMNSPTHGKVTDKQMMNIIKDFIIPNYEYSIAVGTDSQEHSKVVKVLAVIRIGYGGIFFYESKPTPDFPTLRQKIYYETTLSLELASKVTTFLSENEIDKEVEIHIDIGKQGKTKELIAEITGWVRSSGYITKIKPESYVASTIADRISK